MHLNRFEVKNSASHFTQRFGFSVSIATYLLEGIGNRSFSGTQEHLTCNPGKLNHLQRAWKMPSPLCLKVCVSKMDDKETHFLLVTLKISFSIKTMCGC